MSQKNHTSESASETRAIRVETVDIFPIIKKWLYSDHEVFLRELVSNAVDAIEKRAQLGDRPNDPQVNIEVDRDSKTITIRDNGIGMTAEEVEKYLGQIAFSGASEFVKKLQAQNISGKDPLIGQFGLGFYSAFMVADRVEVYSQSMRVEEKPILWVCKGEAEYDLSTPDAQPVGTRIVLHLAPDAEEFLDADRLRGILKTYCNFMRYPVALAGEVINQQAAIWTKRPSDLQEKDYLDLFHFLYPMEEDPLFWIHFNLDYPFELQGILYFPQIHRLTDVRAGNVSLYCKQVFVSDKVQDVVPEFLTLLKGIIDSPEIPLNVSRSALQGDPKIRMISEHIVKKVADALQARFKDNREQFEKDWEHLAPFVKIGLVQHEKFRDRALGFLLYEVSGGAKVTLAEYQEKHGGGLAALAKDHAGEVFLYAPVDSSAGPILEALRKKDLEALLSDGDLDLHVFHFLEGEKEKRSFLRFDAEIDRLLSVEPESELVTGTDQKTRSQRLEEVFRGHVGEDITAIKVGAMGDGQLPAVLKIDESGRRMGEMMRGMAARTGKPLGKFPLQRTLVLNSNHPLIQNVLAVADRPSAEALLPLLCREVVDLAHLTVEPLSSEDKDAFLKRTVELLQQLTR